MLQQCISSFSSIILFEQISDSGTFHIYLNSLPVGGVGAGLCVGRGVGGRVGGGYVRLVVGGKVGGGVGGSVLGGGAL